MFPGLYVLHGDDNSFFTRKLEAVLRHKRIAYRSAARPMGKDAIAERAGSHAIPALHTPEDWVLRDSTPIALLLDQRFPERPLLPNTPVQRIACRLFEEWIDEWFTRAAMYTRWEIPGTAELMAQRFLAKGILRRPLDELDQAERAAVTASARPLGAMLENFMGRGTGERVASTRETGADIPVWFEAFLVNLSRHLEDHDYLLGNSPCLADFAFTGGAVAHFLNDPFPLELIERVAPSVARYVERCWDTPETLGKWIADDAIPETWSPFWSEMARGFVPYLEGNRKALRDGDEWVPLDLGYGPTRMIAVPYREQSRMDVRDEILRLGADEQAQLRQAIPSKVLDVYLLPGVLDLAHASGTGLFPPRSRAQGLRMQLTAMRAFIGLRLRLRGRRSAHPMPPT
ncbi:MAG: glutathione S-transferase [Planctomycetota bacterium]|jgi:glutathione S-transferase